MNLVDIISNDNHFIHSFIHSSVITAPAEQKRPFRSSTHRDLMLQTKIISLRLTHHESTTKIKV